MKIYDIKEKIIDLTFDERNKADVDNLSKFYDYLALNTDLEIEQLIESKYVAHSLSGVLYKIKFI